MKKILNKYKTLIIIIVIVLVVIGVGLGLFSLVAPDYHKSLYGNRLENLKKHKIDSKIIENIKKEGISLGYVTKVNYDLKGKIANFVVTVKGDTSFNDSKIIGDIILDKLEDKEKQYYDIQVFIVSDKKSEVYPIIGYKHRTSEALVWSE